MPGHDCKGDDCFACKVKTIGVAPSATPSRRNKIAPQGPRYNNWEKGTVSDERGMPLLDSQLNPIGTKEYAEKYRRSYTENRKRSQTGE